MDEISLRVPLVVSPGGPVVMRNLATCRKTYYATVYVGMPVRKRYFRMGFRRASEAREYARRVCDRYYQLWRAEQYSGAREYSWAGEYSGAEQLAKEISVEGG